jgi:serine/threonine protein kinase
LLSARQNALAHLELLIEDEEEAVEVDITQEEIRLASEDLIPASKAPTVPVSGVRCGSLPVEGELIGDTYRIVREAGRGGMGVVFLAVDEHLQRNVAIKLFHCKLRDPSLRERFLAEARAMAVTRHPQVASIFAFGEHESVPYFVMEYVDGGTVQDWLDASNGAPDIELALNILDDACRGLSAIHAAGAVHRDIKPSNLLLDRDRRARVADFGLVARSYDEQRIHEVAGTLAYMAPEISFVEKGEVAVASERSDVYSLGCVAYELLTGQPPFDAQTDLALALEHATGVVVPPSLLRPELSSAFDRVIQRALAKRPEDRTPSVEAFRRELMEARQQGDEPAYILVAEDDPDFRELLGIALSDAFPGVRVECVDNGRAVVETFDQDPASVVVLDLNMPDLDGMGVTALLRSRQAGADVPIIVLTASGGPAEWQMLSSLGADRFLVKPVNLDDVAATIRSALKQRRSSRNSDPNLGVSPESRKSRSTPEVA